MNNTYKDSVLNTCSWDFVIACYKIDVFYHPNTAENATQSNTNQHFDTYFAVFSLYGNILCGFVAYAFFSNYSYTKDLKRWDPVDELYTVGVRIYFWDSMHMRTIN